MPPEPVPLEAANRFWMVHQMWLSAYVTNDHRLCVVVLLLSSSPSPSPSPSPSRSSSSSPSSSPSPSSPSSSSLSLSGISLDLCNCCIVNNTPECKVPAV